MDACSTKKPYKVDAWTLWTMLDNLKEMLNFFCRHWSRQIVDTDQSRVQQQVLLALAAAYYRWPSAAWARAPAAVIEPFIRAAPDTRHQHQPSNEGVKDSLDYGGPVPGIKQCLKCRPPPSGPAQQEVSGAGDSILLSTSPHLQTIHSCGVGVGVCCLDWKGRGGG